MIKCGTTMEVERRDGRLIFEEAEVAPLRGFVCAYCCFLISYGWG